jgi:hypothetical protein
MGAPVVVASVSGSVDTGRLSSATFDLLARWGDRSLWDDSRIPARAVSVRFGTAE